MKDHSASVTQAIAAAAVVVVALLAQASVADAQSAISVSPSSAPQGGTITVSGNVPVSGNAPCAAGDAAQLTSSSDLFPPDGFGPQVARDATGNFQTQYVIPATTPAGNYSIGVRCGGGNVGITASLQVTGVPRPASRHWLEHDRPTRLRGHCRNAPRSASHPRTKATDDCQLICMRVFRIAVPSVRHAEARVFYEQVLGMPADDTVPSRLYFHCGDVIVALIDWTDRGAGGRVPRHARRPVLRDERTRRGLRAGRRCRRVDHVTDRDQSLGRALLLLPRPRRQPALFRGRHDAVPRPWCPMVLSSHRRTGWHYPYKVDGRGRD